MSTSVSKRTKGLLLIATALRLTAITFAACTPPPSLQSRLKSGASADLYGELGSYFGDHREYACAAQAYESAVKLAPNSSRFQYLLGLSLHFSGQSQAAIAPLQRSIELAPGVLKPHLVLAEALEQVGRFEDASIHWHSALKLDRSSTEALHGLARGLLKNREYTKVIALLRPTPGDPILISDLAQSYMGLKIYDEAFKVLNSALKKKPSSEILANALVRIEMQRYQYQAAEKLCASTARQHPSDMETQILYLQVLLLTGNKAVGQPLGKKLLKLAPHDFRVLVVNGVMEYDLGEFKSAREHLQQAIALNPSVSAPHFRLGLTLTQLGELQPAREELEKALALGATEPEVHLQLGKLLRSLGENAASAEQLKQYRESLQQQHNAALAASKTAQADKALEAGDAVHAAAFYREALTATPDDAELNFKLAVALDKQADIPGERVLLEKAIQLNPDMAPAQNQLGFLDSESGDAVAAEKHFREAIRAAPAFTEAWVNLAATLGLQSRFPEAGEAVESALQLEPMNPQALLLRDTLAKAQALH